MFSRLASSDVDSLFGRKKRLVADPEVTVSQVEAEIDAYLAEVGTNLEIDILDRRLSATVVEESPYDPTNEKLRA